MEEIYLGDGIQATYDPAEPHIRLRTNDGAPQVIYLDPLTLNRLFDFAKRVMPDPEQDAHV
jgi:hypothetical protein